MEDVTRETIRDILFGKLEEIDTKNKNKEKSDWTPYDRDMHDFIYKLYEVFM